MNTYLPSTHTMHTHEAVRDPIWKHIYVPTPLYEVSKSSEFNRLTRIRQLGPTYLVYPGATHTRASHSYGVYHVATRLLHSLLERGARQWVSKQGEAAFMAAALLHDLGHFPYTHSLKELPLKSHEQITADLIRSEHLAARIAQTGADPEQTAAIIDTSFITTDSETLFFRALLSGVLDPDKIDYLTRDAFFCGVPYGTQDIDFIISHLLPHKTYGIALNSAALIAIESVLFAKYAMYRSVYWHKNVRIATAMMKKALYAALQAKDFSAEALYQQDDEGIHRLIESASYEARQAARHVYENRIFPVIAEIPFDEKNPYHIQLENLTFRRNEEKILAQRLAINESDILIDVPERISFESSIWISDLERSFSQSNSVFTSEQIVHFTEALRIIRVAANPDSTICRGSTKKQAEILAENYKLIYTEV